MCTCGSDDCPVATAEPAASQIVINVLAEAAAAGSGHRVSGRVRIEGPGANRLSSRNRDSFVEAGSS